ncbi:HAD-IA family hydrolase [Neorhizobium sp. JUb45]|uniref:HAD-IA family hydrolase n=1 Tax=unclassified Neorhizobium TaxID=2629175 RepID=UPI001044A271|nr:HAD-IA family hydrolase [Neorhizobium sp. JUb45]TCR01738.1 sugar-phosphatase [Neorhizobium sp. JUb45]
MSASLPQKTYDAFLFDMDGTILNSIASAERVWGRWAESHGLDVEKFLPTMHGKRGIDTITELNLPGVDPAAEAAIILQGEIDDVEGVVPIPGAIEFLASIPPEKWAIVTSSPIMLAKRRLAAAGITEPRFMVTAEDVKVGKPNPQCYILGAERVGISPAEALVFEDVMAGVKAGEGAGADVAVISHTHAHPLETSHLTIADYRDLTTHVDADGRLSLQRR